MFIKLRNRFLHSKHQMNVESFMIKYFRSQKGTIVLAIVFVLCIRMLDPR